MKDGTGPHGQGKAGIFFSFKDKGIVQSSQGNFKFCLKVNEKPENFNSAAIKSRKKIPCKVLLSRGDAVSKIHLKELIFLVPLLNLLPNVLFKKNGEFASFC